MLYIVNSKQNKTYRKKQNLALSPFRNNTPNKTLILSATDKTQIAGYMFLI